MYPFVAPPELQKHFGVQISFDKSTTQSILTATVALQALTGVQIAFQKNQ